MEPQVPPAEVERSTAQRRFCALLAERSPHRLPTAPHTQRLQERRMDKATKSTVVKALATELGEHDSLFVADYRGLDVATITELRGKLREAGSHFKIVKNTLAKRAAEEAGKSELVDLFSGPSAIAFVKDDAAAVAKVLQEMAKQTDVIEVRGGMLDGAPVDQSQIKEIASLPAREVILAMLLSAVNAPMTQMVGVLNAPLRDIVGIIDAYIEKLGGEDAAVATAPVEEAPAAEEAPAEAPAEEAASEEAAPAEEAPAEDASAEEASE
jgi:large subunit ribosomal protein L10